MSEEQDPTLRLLRVTYGDRWFIRRTERLWIASTRDRDSEHAPTLIETDVEKFVAQLEDPPARVGQFLLSENGIHFTGKQPPGSTGPRPLA
ncbi:hypothetical protein [Nocardiopsis ansamitocini]|uniref:Uncharacterized protein n=1 Tax=Nocardiopsis ansamitocini TaxID=1670832 RepID=A0A9W6P4U2_9ACTN|nr:hypothetical protein [Nocardiopsis ansamitocini]GLU47113.1 hypothetical protein Nans01_14640 [Nocardiopsis ansamitocini]